MKTQLLVILSPPRSFSSVISTMIGQHPDIYGFPELHVFIGNTLQEVLDREYKVGNYFGPPGLLRAVAELEWGYQTSESILKAVGWLGVRRKWSTKKLMDYLLEKVNPLLGIEKSPITSLQQLWIERAYSFFPNAYFLHLTRHPVSTRKSIDIFLRQPGRSTRPPTHDSLLTWYRFHRNIIEFTRTLPTGQSMRIKGEDLMAYPDVFLPQIAEWMGIRTDLNAIEAMKHPEKSPYAFRGPYPAHGGNDGNFMRNPSLTDRKIIEPSLRGFINSAPISWLDEHNKSLLNQIGYDIAKPKELASEILSFSSSLGYY